MVASYRFLAAAPGDLTGKPQMIIATKIDTLGPREERESPASASSDDGNPAALLRRHCEEKGLPFAMISAVTGEGVRELVQTVGRRLRAIALEEIETKVTVENR